jgi:hypothetical protein
MRVWLLGKINELVALLNHLLRKIFIKLSEGIISWKGCKNHYKHVE